MASGIFEAIAVEQRSLADPLFYVPLIGTLQIFLFLGLDGYLYGPYVNECAPLYLTSCYPSWAPLFDDAMAGSLLLFVVSLVAIGVSAMLQSVPPGNCQVLFVDNRDAGGSLLLSYTNSKGKRRESLQVSKVKAFANRPLLRTKGRLVVPVEGTESSMDVFFEGKRFSLFLGFPDATDMDDIYEQLKDYGAPRLEAAILKRPLGLRPHAIRHLAFGILGVALAAGLAFYAAFLFPADSGWLFGLGLYLAVFSAAGLTFIVSMHRWNRRQTSPADVEDAEVDKEAERLRKEYREKHPELAEAPSDES